ncbi:MAG TPA: SPW repeat protein [Sphingomonas sp.]|nr:SPW repeat protein [Sphingomonas sp.]
MAYEPETAPINAPRSQRWQDWINVLLAIWLFISPWVLAFGTGTASYGPNGYGVAPAGTSIAASSAAWNAWIFGVIVFLIALSALGRMQFWQEWINLLIGIWLFISPWVLSFVGLRAASWDHWVVGALVFIFAVWNMATAPALPWARRRTTPPPRP